MKTERFIALEPEEYERIRRVLDSFPGPTPWYATKIPPIQPSGKRELFWTVKGYSTNLINKENEVFLSFGAYSYVNVLTPSTILEWHIEKDSNISSAVTRINTFDVDSLSSINPNTSNFETERNTGVVYSNGLIDYTRISSSLDPGHHRVIFPPILQTFSELLFLVETSSSKLTKDRRSPHVFGNSVLYLLHPPHNEIEVIPLDWWNNEDRDFGHEWITRIGRDPLSGKLIGDGIRCGIFMLDPGNFSFLGWVSEESHSAKWGDLKDKRNWPSSHEVLEWVRSSSAIEGDSNIPEPK